MTNHSKTNKNNIDLSHAAATMRSSNSSPQEKSKAASVMGHEGGKHRHANDNVADNRSSLTRGRTSKAHK